MLSTPSPTGARAMDRVHALSSLEEQAVMVRLRRNATGSGCAAGVSGGNAGTRGMRLRTSRGDGKR